MADLGGDLVRGPEPTHARIDVERGLLLGVFDGMGGMRSGELASDEAARVLLSSLREAPG